MYLHSLAAVRLRRNLSSYVNVRRFHDRLEIPIANATAERGFQELVTRNLDKHLDTAVINYTEAKRLISD